MILKHLTDMLKLKKGFAHGTNLQLVAIFGHANIKVILCFWVVFSVSPGQYV